MAGYNARQSTYTDGDVIDAADSNDEFDAILAAFVNTTGHAHDGTAGEGPVIGLIGDAGVATPLNKVVVDTTNDRLGFFVDVSSSAVEQVRIQDGAILPVTTNDIDLGSSSLQFKDIYLDGTATIDGLAMPTTTVTDILDQDDMSSDSATALATQQSIKAYVDSQVTAQDLDFQGDSGGSLSIDLDSEVLDIAGGTGIDTSGAANTLTVAIDSTVLTDASTHTLTNKTFNANGTGNSLSNVEVADFAGSAIVTESEGIGSNDNDTTLPTSAAVKDYVDTQITAEDLDITTDSGTIAIDLDSETLTVSGGTGIDSSATGNAVTLAIDSTVVTLSGTQTLTNKTFDANGTGNSLSNVEVADFAAASIVTEAEGIGSNDNDTTLPTSAAVKDYVDTQITAEDLDITTDSGTIAIDLDSETLTVSGGTGIDSSATGNAVTVAIDSTVATLTGTQTLTNKSIDASQLTGTVANARLDQQLQDVAGLTPTDGNIIVGDGTNFVAESGATARASLGLTIGTDVQAYDAQLADIAGLTPTDGNVIIGDGSNFVLESGATLRTSLGLTIGTDVQAYDAELAALAGLSSAADKVPYFTGSGTAAVADFTSFGRSLVDDANAAAARTTLDVDQAGTAVALAIALG